MHGTPNATSQVAHPNFLRDPALARMLVDRAGLTDTDLVYEIGAGAGTITAALVAAAVDPALRPVRVTFDAWLRLHAAFLRMPDPLRSHVVGAEARLRRQQSHLQKEHRSRAPRDALGPGTRASTTDRGSRRPSVGSPAMLSG